jgi:hypothetical protein
MIRVLTILGIFFTAFAVCVIVMIEMSNIWSMLVPGITLLVIAVGCSIAGFDIDVM